METEEIEEALKIIFPDGRLLRDNCRIAGFIDHTCVYGYYSDRVLVLKPVDNGIKELVSYLKEKFGDLNDPKRPDIREVYNFDSGRKVQITYGPLPWLGAIKQ